MRRICLCLLILFAFGNVAARDVKLSSPDGASSPDNVATPKAAARKPVLPARDSGSESRVRPTVHGDVNTAPRLRWHSFLPGMFR